jgi:GNAT superfamily N-acetyltransferase
MNDFTLSDDRARLDLARVHDWLASSYWSPGIARETVERAIAGSHCLGAYRDGGQVAFARMITDHATFAWLADVWVDEPWRGHGLGKRLVAWFLDHPDYDGIRRFALVTRDAHDVYAANGFYPLIRPDRYMERLAPGFADALRTAT